TFEKILTNANDITLYARPTNSGQPTRVEVYTENGTELIATFENIDQEGTYQILLTNLQTPTDTFDLKVIDNNIDIDYIVDPTLYWVGTVSANTNNKDNWSTVEPTLGTCPTGDASAAPTSSDAVIFDADCDADATINAAFNALGVDINSGYIGTITQSNGTTITVSTSGDWTQADGVFVGGDSTSHLDVNRDFTLSGGTFTPPAGNFLMADDFTISGGTYNEGTGTISFDGGLDGIVNVVTTETFNNVTINNGGQITYISNGDTIVVNGTLTLTNGRFLAGTTGAHTATLNAKGAVSVGAGSDGGSSVGNQVVTLLIDWSDSQSVTIAAGAKMPKTTLNNTSATITTSGTGTVNWFDLLTLTAGTFEGGTVTVDLDGGLTIDGGTYTATTDNTKIGRNWSRTSGTFTPNGGTVTFDHSATQSITGETFYDLTINNTAGTPSGTTDVDPTAAVTVTNTLTVTDGQFSPQTDSDFNNVTVGAAGLLVPDGSAILNVSGDWSNAGTYTDPGLGGIVYFDKASGTQTINSGGTGTTQDFTNITKSTGGTLQLVTNAIDIDGTLTITSPSTVDINGLNLTAATLDNVGTFQLEGGETVTITTPETAEGTILYDGAGDYTTGLAYPGDAYYNLTFNGTGSWTLDATLDVNNTITLTAGTLDVSGSNYGITTTSWTDTGAGAFTEGTGTVTFDVAGGTINSNETFENVTINHAGTTTLGAALDLDDTLTISGGDLDVSGTNYGITAKSWTDTGAGTFTEGTGTVTFDVAGGTINSNETFENVTINHAGTTTLGAALDLDDTLTISGGALDVSGTNYGITLKSWTDTGAGTFTEGTGTVTFDVAGGTINSNDAFNSVTINHGGTSTLGAALDVDGNLTITSGILSSSGNNVNLAGNWSNSDTYTHGSNTVTLDGSDQTITCGSSGTTFNNLTKTVSVARALTFTASQTCTVAGTFTVEGASGALLSLRSSTEGTQWKIDPQGTRTVSYLDVKDSNNINSTAISCLTSTNNCTNSGNNTNWTFAVVAATSSSSAPKPPSGVGEYIETIAEIPEKIVVIPEAIVEGAKRITEQVANIQKQLADLIRPKQEKPTEIVTVPEEPPFVFKKLVELLPAEPIKQFVLAPLPRELQFFTEKFVGLENVLKEVGISKISDITKLENKSINLPGLTESASILSGELEIGSLSKINSIPVSELSFEAKQKIPSEIVFAKTGAGLIDMNINLSINNRGEPEQRIKTISGKPLELVVKPDKPVKKIKGYLILRRKEVASGFLQDLFEKTPASLIGSVSGVQPQNNKTEVEQKLVLQEFEYTDSNKDGIYRANIQAPLVDGEYEVITIMDYEDPKLALRELQLIVVIDPEGYVYEQLPSGQLRIKDAKVSLYWLNPDSPAGERNYELWPAQKYLQNNPHITDDTGKYSFLVPKGNYYLKVVANNYSDYQTESFSVTESDGVHMNVEMKKKFWWGILIDWLKKII
ncbi:MAG: hypothetical protein Q7K33_03905, partial [Candidatus Berkelbacteria bacterium]|nr:hypothetical protein [Candidatus Berkelbacteria bacterium]